MFKVALHGQIDGLRASSSPEEVSQLQRSRRPVKAICLLVPEEVWQLSLWDGAVGSFQLDSDPLNIL